MNLVSLTTLPCISRSRPSESRFSFPFVLQEKQRQAEEIEALVEAEQRSKDGLRKANRDLEEKQVELETLQEELTTTVQIKGEHTTVQIISELCHYSFEKDDTQRCQWKATCH